MADLQIHQFMCGSDNFGVLVHDSDSGATASIDAPSGVAIRKALADTGWKLSHILITHHHFDHVEGNESLKAEFGCRIAGPKGEAAKIPDIDDALGDGDNYSFAGHNIEIIATPGHTLGGISLYFRDDGVVFTGDTLFAVGCGRVFEGTPDMMWQSLQRLALLPEETVVYCGHEYTLANARFAITVDPDNEALANRLVKIEKLRAQDKPTLPSTIGLERATNPFLRPADPAIRKNLNMQSASDAKVFAEIRARKDRA